MSVLQLNSEYVVENIQNKDNLLITIGDSWTAGVGAYDEKFTEKLKKNEVNAGAYKSESINRFKEHSWPWLLAQKLNWDLVNLGEGGMSNIGAAKKLFEYDLIRKTIYQKYKKIVLIFILSNHDRYTFYSDNRLLKIIPSFSNDNSKGLTEACYTFFHDKVIKNEFDPLYESRFALKTVEAYSRAHNMSFLYGAGFYPISQFNQIYNTPANLHNYSTAKKRLKDYIPIPEHVWDDPQYMSPCKHPNRLSYKLIAEGLYTDLFELYFKD